MNGGDPAGLVQRGRFVWIIVAAILLALVFAGGFRWPVGNRSGGAIEPLDFAGNQASGGAARPHSTTAPTHLRLATFNIHSCIDNDAKYDPALTAATLRGFDLATLNECRGNGLTTWNDPKTLGSLLHMHSMFFPVEIYCWHKWFGNGLLTNIPITRWQTTRLPSSFRMAYRQVDHLTVPFGNTTLNILMVHVGKKSDREQQFKQVAAMFLQQPEPAILMGDMNTRPDDPMVKDLLAHGVEDPVGQRLTYARDRVDFIFTRGVKWTDAGLIENRASDHPLAWAEIEAR